MRCVKCPSCGKDISETYEPIDEDVGILGGCYYCHDCNLIVEMEDDEDE